MGINRIDIKGRTADCEANRRRVFAQAMRCVLKNPRDCLKPGNSIIEDLIYGWGNPVWSALAEYLSSCIRHSLRARGPILECGSGLTTIVVGAVAKRRGLSHWALEHKPEWAERVRSCLTAYQLLRSVTLCVSPLRNYGEFDWYAPPLGLMPAGFSLVICDGPPGNTRGGRYGLVPVMMQRLRPGSIILLDDAGRRNELEIGERWQAELDASFQIHGVVKPYIRLRIRTPRKVAKKILESH